MESRFGFQNGDLPLTCHFFGRPIFSLQLEIFPRGRVLRRTFALSFGPREVFFVPDHSGWTGDTSQSPDFKTTKGRLTRVSWKNFKIPFLTPFVECCSCRTLSWATRSMKNFWSESFSPGYSAVWFAIFPRWWDSDQEWNKTVRRGKANAREAEGRRRSKISSGQAPTCGLFCREATTYPDHGSRAGILSPRSCAARRRRTSRLRAVSRGWGDSSRLLQRPEAETSAGCRLQVPPLVGRGLRIPIEGQYLIRMNGPAPTSFVRNRFRGGIRSLRRVMGIRDS